MKASPGRRLRDMLAGPEVVLAPGAYEPLVARIIEKVGYPAIYAGGSGISSAVFGRPDMGLTTMTEVRDAVRNIANAVSLPVLGDIDQGFGDIINVRRSIREFEWAGLAGIHIEDEAGASKHASGSVPVPVDRMCEKVEVAAAAREDADFMIFARSDALRTLGMEETIHRCRQYIEAGADGLWVFTGLNGTVEEFAHIARAFPDLPLIFDWSVRATEARVPLSEVRAMGYRLVILPNLVMFGLVNEATRLLTHVRERESMAELVAQVAPIGLVDELVGLVEARDFQRKHSAPSYVGSGEVPRFVIGEHPD
jgi:2-methylisocitrate lyase-like PEP mutase family enzyme